MVPAISAVLRARDRLASRERRRVNLLGWKRGIGDAGEDEEGRLCKGSVGPGYVTALDGSVDGVCLCVGLADAVCSGGERRLLQGEYTDKGFAAIVDSFIPLCEDDKAVFLVSQGTIPSTRPIPDIKPMLSEVHEMCFNCTECSVMRTKSLDWTPNQMYLGLGLC